MGFLDDYEPVAVRQARWWTEFPKGRILTNITNISANGVVIRAELYRDEKDERPYATGHAHEVQGDGNVNKTSHLENCETSAIGRALAAAGFAGSDPDKRPSREEMSKTQRAQAPVRPAGPPKPRTEEAAWRDILDNPNGWYDNRDEPNHGRKPDFKAKKGNDPFDSMGEYRGNSAPLALWLNSAPEGFQEALMARDAGEPYEGMIVQPGDSKVARGKTVDEGRANLQEQLGAEEVPPPTEEPS